MVNVKQKSLHNTVIYYKKADISSTSTVKMIRIFDFP